MKRVTPVTPVTPVKQVLIILSLAVIISASARSAAQSVPDLPDAPRTQPAQYTQPAAKCGPWSCWNYPDVPTLEVLRSRSFLLSIGGEVGLAIGNAEVIHSKEAHGQCSILNHRGLESRGRLYLGQAPIVAVVGVVDFVWGKVKGPKYIVPGFNAYPAIVHIRNMVHWEEDCY